MTTERQPLDGERPPSEQAATIADLETTVRKGFAAVRPRDRLTANRRQQAQDALREMAARAKRAEAALRKIAEQQPKTLAWLRANGIVFDGPLGTDPKNWEHVAFSIYNDLCEVDAIARREAHDE